MGGAPLPAAPFAPRNANEFTFNTPTSGGRTPVNIADRPQRPDVSPSVASFSGIKDKEMNLSGQDPWQNGVGLTPGASGYSPLQATPEQKYGQVGFQSAGPNSSSPWGSMVVGPDGQTQKWLNVAGVLADVREAGNFLSEVLQCEGGIARITGAAPPVAGGAGRAAPGGGGAVALPDLRDSVEASRNATVPPYSCPSREVSRGGGREVGR